MKFSPQMQYPILKTAQRKYSPNWPKFKPSRPCDHVSPQGLTEVNKTPLVDPLPGPPVSLCHNSRTRRSQPRIAGFAAAATPPSWALASPPLPTILFYIYPAAHLQRLSPARLAIASPPLLSHTAGRSRVPPTCDSDRPQASAPWRWRRFPSSTSPPRTISSTTSPHRPRRIPIRPT